MDPHTDHSRSVPDTPHEPAPPAPPPIVYDTDAPPPAASLASRLATPLLLVVIGAAIGIGIWYATHQRPARTPATASDYDAARHHHYRSNTASTANGATPSPGPLVNRPADNMPPRGAAVGDAPTPPADNAGGPDAEPDDLPTDGSDTNPDTQPASANPRGRAVPPGTMLLPTDPEALDAAFPLDASNVTVAQLLTLLRFKDFPAIAQLLGTLRQNPELAWMIVASALVHTDDMASRAVLVGILAGDFPELGWVGDQPKQQRATGILFMWLLLHNPDWVRPRGAGYEPFQKRMLLTMFRLGSPPAPATVGTASASDATQMRLMLGMLRETDDDEVRIALLAFAGRRMAGASPDLRPAVVLDVMMNLRDNVAGSRDVLAGLLSAIWLTDAATGADVLSDALLNGDATVRRAAAILAMRGAWEQGRLVPAGSLWQHLLDSAVPPEGARPMTGESRVDAIDLIDDLMTGDALDAQARDQLNSRLEPAVFALPVDGTTPGEWDSQLRARQIGVLAWLRPDDSNLMARLLRVARQDADIRAQLAAWSALGTMTPGAVGDALRDVARDTAAGIAVRTTALQSLADWSDRAQPDEAETTRSLFARLINESATPSPVRAISSRLLGERSAFDPAHRAMVRRVAEQDADPAVRAAAIVGYALGTPADADAERDATVWLKNRARIDSSPVVRNAADRALSMLPLARDNQ